MMFSYPYFRSPFYRNYHRYSYSRTPYRIPESYLYTNTTPIPSTDKNTSNDSSSETRKKENDMEFFEILGIKLYFDDILLICLLFFLYTEGVDDQSLFIALILLLLS